jgi:RNA polymerase sigma factor (sigma-70 family)
MERGSTSEQLMAEMAWVRRLARALVHDSALADDVAQEAWIVAAEKAPDEDRPLRPWLARVVMTLARTRRRGELRRGLREQAADVELSVPSSDELIERVELQRIVAGEVLALAEPYRSTILLHFVEGYTSAEIARRMGIPSGTVRRRLKTALDQLRAALRARPDQPPKGWLGALVPLVPSTPATIGVIAMKKLAIAIAIIALLLVAAFVGFSRRDRGHARSPQPADLARGPTAFSRAIAPGLFPAWLAQVGAPDRRIAGQVLAGGAPVAKATVRLGLVVDGAAGQLVAEVKSDDQGAFDFGMEPAATFTVSAGAAGHSPASVTIELAAPNAHPDRITLVLGDCRAHMFGTVTDASGGPIAKARLSVAGLSGGETDVGGQYSICLPLDAPTLRIDADGYGSLEERIGTTNGVQTMTGELRRDFLLVPEAVLAGKVVDSKGQPVAGARVIARPALAEARRHIATGWADSANDGAFRIAGLAPAQFELIASADGLASAAPVAAVARAASTSTEIRLVLARVARVRGQVVEGGAAVAGAAVVAANASRLESRKSVSQADGTFVLDGVPMGTVAFTAAPYEVTAPKLVTIDRTEVDHVKLEVTAPTKIHGHVTRAGKPIAGAQVTTDDGGHRTIADAIGAYTLDGLPTGTVMINAWDVREKAFSLAKRVVLAPGDDQEVDLDLDGSGEIQGVVVDEAGHPVSGAYVEFHLANGGDDACEGMTDAEGRFDCPMLLGGDYAARVQPSQDTRKGFAPATDPFPIVHVKPREVVTGVRLAIRNERLSIRGVVVADGGPVADVRVEVLGNNNGSVDVPSAMANVDGGFEIRDLARGTYAVHAHAADGSDGVVHEIAAGGDPVTIKLARPGSIDGTLTGFTTPPTVTATLSAVFTESLATVSGATFSITGLSPGRYVVQATAGADLDASTVDVKSGETAHVVLKSRGTGRVEGAAYEYGTTKPVIAARCGVAVAVGGGNFTMDSSRQGFTDAAGRFALDAPIGHARIVCIPPEPPWSGAGAEVDVEADKVAGHTVYSVLPTFGATTGSVGLKVQPLTFPITVGTVDPHGPAAAAGVQVGDHLVSIDGGSLDGLLPIGAWYLILNHAAGTTATLGIEHGGATRQVTVPVVDGGPP